MLASFQKLSFFLKKRKFTYIISLSALIIVNIIGVLPPLIIGPAVDSITRGALTSKYLYWYVGVLALISLVDYALTYTWAYLLFSNAKLLEKTLRLRMMDKILGMRQPFFEKFKSGDLMTRATEDLEAVQQLVGFGVLAFTDSIIYLGAIILAMGMAISWKLTLLCIFPLPLLAYIIHLVGQYIHKSYTDQQKAFDGMSNAVLEFVSGIKLVRSYVMEGRTYDQFQEITEDVYHKSLKTEIISGSFWQMTKIFTALSYAVAIGYGAVLIGRGEISLGDLISFNVYLGYLVWPIFTIGEFINIAQRGTSSIQRVFEILEEEDLVGRTGQDGRDISTGENCAEKGLAGERLAEERLAEERRKGDGADHREASEVHLVPAVQFKNYSFRYPSAQVDQLKGIHLTLAEGQTLGIAGKTGSGKSTFLKQLLAEYPKGTGDLLVFGQPMEAIDRSALLGDIAYVAQESILFFTTIRENILFGKGDAGEEEIAHAVAMADLQKDLDQFPQGLETIVGERGVSVSGGQKQRISIARALIKDASLLLLDDALSAVDARTEHRIIENIKAIRAGKTNIIVSHRLSAIQHADEIIVIEDGSILERGSHADLMAQGGWYQEQYQIQLASASES